MRSNITYVLSSDNKIYIKDGHNIYELNNYNQEEFTECWKNIQSKGKYTIKKDLDCLRNRLEKFLTSIGAFNEISNIEDQLTSVGLTGSGRFSDITIGVCGDSDLVQYYCLKYSSIYNIIELQTFNENFDFGLILAREYNTKKYLCLNSKMFSIGEKIFDSLLFSVFSFIIGPHTIPRITSCLECMHLHELDNNFYGSILEKFDQIEHNSKEFISETMMNLGLSFYETQVMKQILSNGKNAVEIENSQKILSYNLLEGIWEEHHLLKHPDCKNCFQKRATNSQIFEVDLYGD